MKQTFTFLAAALLSISQSFGQNFNETFEGKTTSNLTTSGWTLSGALDVNTSSQITGTNSLRFDATNSSTTANVKTPDITLVEQYVNVFFRFRSGTLSGNGTTRTINYGFRDNSGFTSLGIITLTPANNNTAVQAVSKNETVIPNTTVRLEFQLSANNNQGEDLFIDDVRVTSSALAPLPIRLLSFTGNLSNNKAQLSWSVAENETGDRFEIEKSLDGRTYTTEAVVATTEKEGTENYVYSAAQEITGNTSFRLKIINKNSTISYSRVIYLKKETSASQGIHMLQNPIGSSLAFTVDAEAAGVASVNVYNTAGVKVHSFSAKMKKGSNTIIQAVDNKLSTGNYVLEVVTPTERKTIKISK